MTSAVLKNLLPLYQPCGVHGYIFYSQKNRTILRTKSLLDFYLIHKIHDPTTMYKNNTKIT